MAAEASELAEALTADGNPALRRAWGAALLAASRAGSVAAYCDAAALGAAVEERGAPNAVQVLTLHRAKGLEFDHVLLAGLEEGVWPSRQAEQQGALAEERRLFYVGLTRARRTLRLSWVRHRRDWAGKPSRFLGEIPPEVIEGTAMPEPEPAPAKPGPVRAAAAAARARPPPSQAETDRLVAEFRSRRPKRGAG